MNFSNLSKLHRNIKFMFLKNWMEIKFLVILQHFQLYHLIFLDCGPGSSVGIATGYELDDPGIES
jgi:hypothetical protein